MNCFVLMVLCFAVALTVIGSVSYFMAELYLHAFVCYSMATFLWIPFLVLDVSGSWVWTLGDVSLILLCFFMSVASKVKAEEEAKDEQDKGER